jgi:hypothetical protein
MAFVIDGWEMPHSFAARVKLSSRQSTRKYRTWSSVMVALRGIGAENAAPTAFWQL